MSSIGSLELATEYIAAKNYKDALLHCEAMLAGDQGSYEIFVITGSAAFHLKEYIKAEAAYKRASELDSSGIIAWQGLAELYNETDQWAAAAAAFAVLVDLASSSSEEVQQARAWQFLRKQADSASRANDFGQAEECYNRLLSRTLTSEERLELNCLKADVQLGFDRLEVERRLQARMDEAAAAGEVISEAVLRLAVEAEWAEEGLEMEMDHASATLRDIISIVPPSPRYAPYYDAYLRRLRKYQASAPSGSMERHNRRVAVLSFCRTMMEGRGAGTVGGCCSVTAYEAALSVLEVEGDVVGTCGVQSTPTNASEDGSVVDGASDQGLHHPHPLTLNDSEAITQRLVHSFPWSPTGQVHLALTQRRRALRTAGATPATVEDGPSWVTNLSSPVKKHGSAQQAAATQRKFMLRELLAGMKRGVPSAAGWLAAADLLLEQHQELKRQQIKEATPAAVITATAQAALDAAREGLRYVAHRDFLGKEHMEQAGLLLRLAAARALLALGACVEADAFLTSLAERVSEGQATFGLLAGMAPVSVSQQAERLLAQSALAQGDRAGARRRYECLVGRGAMGRSTAVVEPWALAEYGWMMMEEGDVELARQHLEAAVQAAHQQQQYQQEPSAAAELASTQLKLAQVYWAIGGELRSKWGSSAHAALLASAAVPGPHQAEAFSWLGRWYGEVGGDEVRARKCYQRALALDPATSEQAGQELVHLLMASGQASAAMQLCAETTAAWCHAPASH